MEKEEIKKLIDEIRDFISGESNTCPDITSLYHSNPEFKEAYDNDPIIKEFNKNWDKWIARE
ncbi:MAG: hypothetical protein CVV42_14280 [Candidatus Riflebacteria bacterium HGW-Riflebacteria-2]|jgi:hypothetical protein|nr:MAG: hypothetical protein CVV42_14280 [Candidatus Riflebacteria bacterium HGW-Riflebacteria-2]